MQQRAREHARRVIEETEKLKRDIHTRSVELDRWYQQQSEQEATTINERRKFEEEKKKVNLCKLDLDYIYYNLLMRVSSD